MWEKSSSTGRSLEIRGGDEMTEGGKQMLSLDADTIRVCLRLPEGYKFLPDGQHQVSIRSSDEGVVRVPEFSIPDLGFDWRIPVDVRSEGEARLTLEGMVFFCPVSDESICMFAAPSADLIVRVVEDGDSGDCEFVHDIQVMT
jgi:hypothetical protein